MLLQVDNMLAIPPVKFILNLKTSFGALKGDTGWNLPFLADFWLVRPVGQLIEHKQLNYETNYLHKRLCSFFYPVLGHSYSSFMSWVWWCPFSANSWFCSRVHCHKLVASAKPILHCHAKHNHKEASKVKSDDVWSHSLSHHLFCLVAKLTEPKICS